MQPLISDIQTTDLLFYDPDFHEQCCEFCQFRDIDNLPSLEDPEKVFYYDKTKGTFTEEKIGEQRKIDGHIRLFDPSLEGRFRQQPLLFVYTSGYLSGVVHFADYNRPAVSVSLYQTFFEYERALRELLILNGLGDESMGEYFERKAEAAAGKEKDHWTRRLSRYKREAGCSKAPPLQRFYLDDLIGLARDQKVLELNAEVVDLRNGVMHAHDHVSQKDFRAGDAVYDLQSFQNFFRPCAAVHQDLKRVRNRIAYLRPSSTDAG